jgi:isoamylase
MHVDGFRFVGASPLACAAAARDDGEAVGTILYQDPVLSQVKLLAAPWDGGVSGTVGNTGPGRVRYGQEREPVHRSGYGGQGPWAA